jgi:carboxyl-terminal processing protease
MNRLLRALLILNLEILLLVPTCMPQRVDRGIKSTDQYWAETGLGSSELETLLGPESCDHDETSFLACVNAIGLMAERYNLIFTTDGQFRTLEKKDIENKVSEKKDLARWTTLLEKDRPQISFLQAWKTLDEKYVQAPERSTVVATGINGFLSILKDPHTYIMPLAMYEEVVANSETKNSSAGFVARRFKNEMLVRKVYEGSPAFIAGLKKGDRIQSLNGQIVSELLPSQINDFLKMRNVQRLGLQVLRGEKSKFIEILHSEAVYPSVVSKLVESSRRYGVITLNKFSKGTCDSTEKQIISLKEQNIQGLLLDVRDNPGGQVEEASCIINLFVQRGTFLFETRYLDSSKPSDRYVAKNDPVYKGPLAVLINSGSASASEIVAGALRDQNRAKLVGERSYGKGSFQDGRIWGPNPKIAFFETEGLYYFPSGWTPQLVGLQPDVQVNFNLADNIREEDLFLNPLVPVDSWTGPQTLSWLNDKECVSDSLDSIVAIDDPQMEKAQALLNCGEKNDRHGSL